MNPATAQAPGRERGAVAAYAASLARDQEVPLKEALKWLLTTILVPVERRRARKMVKSLPALRVHQGCADHYLGC